MFVCCVCALQVRWLPGSTHMFAATDYAGTVTLWDARSPNVPLGRTEAHNGKALCLHWLPNNNSSTTSSTSSELQKGFRLLSGGSDCCIKATAVDSTSGRGTAGEDMDTAADE